MRYYFVDFCAVLNIAQFGVCRSHLVNRLLQFGLICVFLCLFQRKRSLIQTSQQQKHLVTNMRNVLSTVLFDLVWQDPQYWLGPVLTWPWFWLLNQQAPLQSPVQDTF